MNPLKRVLYTICVSAIIWQAGTIQAAVGQAFTPIGEAELEKMVAPDGALSTIISKLETTIPLRDASAFAGFIQQDWLLDEITHPLKGANYKASPDLELAFRSGTKQSWEKKSLADEYLGQHFRFLRVHTVAGHTGLLFRSSGENGQLNYCLFHVGQGKDGRLAAYDLYVIGIGESVSDTLRRGYLHLVQSLNPSSEAGRRASVYMESLPRVIEVNTARAAREHERVLALSQSLPAEIRQERTLMLICLEAAENVSWPERTQAFETWRKYHPNPMQLPFKWADFEIASGRYQAATQVLRQLNDVLGGDSYLKARIGETLMLARYQEKGVLIGGAPKTNNPDLNGLGGAR